jgi:inactivated superfamily I helicase
LPDELSLQTQHLNNSSSLRLLLLEDACGELRDKFSLVILLAIESELFLVAAGLANELFALVTAIDEDEDEDEEEVEDDEGKDEPAW